MLSISARNTLLQLANNTTLISQTQQRISSGRKFNSVIEGGADYLKARSYQKSSDELLEYKQNMDDGLSTIKSTLSSIKTSKSMLEQLRSVAAEAQDGRTILNIDKNTQQQITIRFSTPCKGILCSPVFSFMLVSGMKCPTVVPWDFGYKLERLT
ncbi:MAG: flagellin [Alphaproteobacteria bacterium]